MDRSHWSNEASTWKSSDALVHLWRDPDDQVWIRLVSWCRVWMNWPIGVLKWCSQAARSERESRCGQRLLFWISWFFNASSCLAVLDYTWSNLVEIVDRLAYFLCRANYKNRHGETTFWLMPWQNNLKKNYGPHLTVINHRTVSINHTSITDIGLPHHHHHHWRILLLPCIIHIVSSTTT